MLKYDGVRCLRVISSCISMSHCSVSRSFKYSDGCMTEGQLVPCATVPRQGECQPSHGALYPAQPAAHCRTGIR